MKLVWFSQSGSHIVTYFRVLFIFKWFMSQTPYLIQDDSIAPHITGCGILLVVNSLHIIHIEEISTVESQLSELKLFK